MLKDLTDPRSKLADTLRERCVVRAEGRLILSPAAKAQAWMIDARRLALHASGLQLFAALFWERYAQRWPFQVGGLEVGAIPLVAAVQIEGARRGLAVNAFLVRKERKRSGLGNQLEGELDESPIIVIDDILHSGSSLEKVRTALKSVCRPITEAFVLLDYQAPGGEAWREKTQVPVTSLFSLAEFGLSLRGAPRLASVGYFDVRWQNGTPYGHFFDKVPKSAPALDEAKVYFATDAGKVIALDQRTGQEVWSHQVTGAPPLKGIRSTPAVHEDRVYFGAYDGSVTALSASTGEPIWRFDEADWVGSSPALAPDLGLLFVGLEHARPGRKGGLAALSMADGTRAWEMPFQDFVHATPTYARDSGTVLVGSNEGAVVCAHAKTGVEEWRLLLDAPVKAGIAIDGATRLATFGCFDRHIYGVDLDTGMMRWRAPTGYTVYTTPLIHEGRVYCGSADKHFYVLDARRGHIIRRIPIGAKVFCAPRTIEGLVVFGANDGVVYALDPERLEIVAKLQLNDCLTNAIAYRDGLYFALTYMGEMTCFQRARQPKEKQIEGHSLQSA